MKITQEQIRHDQRLGESIRLVQTNLKLFTKKSGQNTVGKGYRYYTESDIYQALKPELKLYEITYLFSLKGEQDVSLIPGGNNKSDMWLFKSPGTLTLSKGDESLVIAVYFTALNTDPAKAQGSALTYGTKYWLCKVFGVPTDELDPDTTENTDAPKAIKKKPVASINSPNTTNPNVYVRVLEKARLNAKFKRKLMDYLATLETKSITSVDQELLEKFERENWND